MTPQQRDALRDKLARLLGWTPTTDLDGPMWDRLATQEISYAHPIPDADLNALAAIWAERLKHWDWSVSKGMDVNRNYSAEAFSPGGDGMRHEFVEDHATEYDARLALTIRCIEAERTQHP